MNSAVRQHANTPGEHGEIIPSTFRGQGLSVFLTLEGGGLWWGLSTNEALIMYLPRQAVESMPRAATRGRPSSIQCFTEFRSGLRERHIPMPLSWHASKCQFKEF
ncbi:MAG TPA: hypothetical protein VI731_02155, partial [Bacteroidia bacterium]|nr:hypothetical protein [Bacteroidia bacterium]